MVLCCDCENVRHWQDLSYKAPPPYGKSIPFFLLFSSIHWFYLILQLNKSFSCPCAENDLVLTACQATRHLLILHKLYLFLRTENKDISIMLLREFHICLEVSAWVKLHSLIIKPKFLIQPTKPEHVRWQWSILHSFSLKPSQNHTELEQAQCNNPLLCCPRVCCMELITLNILCLSRIVAQAWFL